MNTPPASWDPPWWVADLMAYEVDGDGVLCQLSQQMILSPVTVGLLTSNGRPASSTSDFLAPAVQPPRAPASHGQLCCRAGLTAPTTPTAGQAIPLLTHIPPLL